MGNLYVGVVGVEKVYIRCLEDARYLKGARLSLVGSELLEAPVAAHASLRSGESRVMCPHNHLSGAPRWRWRPGPGWP